MKFGMPREEQNDGGRNFVGKLPNQAMEELGVM